MASSRSMRRLVGLVALLGALALSSSAQAAIPNIPNGAGGNLTCTVQTGANAGERRCSGIFTTFDGAPIDINVGFPPAPGERSRRRLPDRRPLPRLGRLEAWARQRRLDRRRLRLLLDERPRLGHFLRRHRPEAHAARVRERLQPPDGHPLRGPRRAGDLRGARRPGGRRSDRGRGADRPAEDRRHRRLLRRRHLDGARRAQGPQDGPGRTTARSSPGSATAASRCGSRPRSPTSRGPTSPTRCSRTGTRSTTSSTRPTCSAAGSA